MDHIRTFVSSILKRWAPFRTLANGIDPPFSRIGQGMLGKKDNDAPTGGQTLNTIIGRGTLVEGKMKVDNSVRIDGTFKGELICSGSLTISQTGEAFAQLQGKEIYINGTACGTVHATKVRLDSQARVSGEIHTCSLSVSEGAILHGTCCMEDEKTKGEKKNAANTLPERKIPADGNPRTPAKETSPAISN